MLELGFTGGGCVFWIRVRYLKWSRLGHCPGPDGEQGPFEGGAGVEGANTPLPLFGSWGGGGGVQPHKSATRR